MVPCAPHGHLGAAAARRRRPAPRILDAGCGTGPQSRRVRPPGQAEGVDFSADAVEFCRRARPRGRAAGRARGAAVRGRPLRSHPRHRRDRAPRRRPSRAGGAAPRGGARRPAGADRAGLHVAVEPRTTSRCTTGAVTRSAGCVSRSRPPAGSRSSAPTSSPRCCRAWPPSGAASPPARTRDGQLRSRAGAARGSTACSSCPSRGGGQAHRARRAAARRRVGGNGLRREVRRYRRGKRSRSRS